MIDAWTEVPPPIALAEYAHLERIKHEKEQLRILALIEAWDRMTPEQKWAEWDKECDAEGSPWRGSEYAEVPGFTPKWCADCMSRVFPDFHGDLSGRCPFDPAHSIAVIKPLRLAEAA